MSVPKQIRAGRVRVIGANGTDLGVMSTRDAVRLATEAGLDLVETNPKATPPVCEIMSLTATAAVSSRAGSRTEGRFGHVRVLRPK